MGSIKPKAVVNRFPSSHPCVHGEVLDPPVGGVGPAPQNVDRPIGGQEEGSSGECLGSIQRGRHAGKPRRVRVTPGPSIQRGRHALRFDPETREIALWSLILPQP